jgi:hypothetical protein
VEEIAALMQEAERADAHIGRSLGQHLSDPLRPLTSSGRRGLDSRGVGDKCGGGGGGGGDGGWNSSSCTHTHADMTVDSYSRGGGGSRSGGGGGGGSRGGGGGEGNELVRRLLKTIDVLQVSVRESERVRMLCWPMRLRTVSKVKLAASKVLYSSK